jgi:HK97 family phage major capsid protein
MAGISTNRTNINLPTEVAQEIMQKTQEQSAVMQLARQIPLPGRGVTIPVITGDPEAGWVEETGAKPVSNPTLATKIMQAYKLAVIVPFSDEFRRDAASLYDAIVARLPLALAAKFDATVFGAASGAPGSNFDTLGGATAQSLSPDAYAGLVAADTAIATAGGIMNGIVLAPQGKGILLAATDNDKRPLFINSVAEGAAPMVLGSRTVVSKGAFVSGSPNHVGIAGDWSQAMYGTVEGVQIRFADQTSLTIGGENINLWEHNMFAVRAEIEVGFRADTACFSVLTA